MNYTKVICIGFTLILTSIRVCAEIKTTSVEECESLTGYELFSCNKKFAEQGDSKAQYALAFIYMHEPIPGIVRDYTKALYWSKKVKTIDRQAIEFEKRLQNTVSD